MFFRQGDIIFGSWHDKPRDNGKYTPKNGVKPENRAKGQKFCTDTTGDDTNNKSNRRTRGKCGHDLIFTWARLVGGA